MVADGFVNGCDWLLMDAHQIVRPNKQTHLLGRRSSLFCIILQCVEDQEVVLIVGIDLGSFVEVSRILDCQRMEAKLLREQRQILWTRMLQIDLDNLILLLDQIADRCRLDRTVEAPIVLTDNEVTNCRTCCSPLAGIANQTRHTTGTAPTAQPHGRDMPGQ